MNKMNKLKTTTMLMAMLCVTGYVRAQTPVDIVQTWTDPGTAGWINDPAQTALSNPGGYLNMQFPDQSMPGFQSDIMRMTIGSSNTLFTNISFRFLAVDILPSTARLYVHSSKSDNYWYLPLADLLEGQWTTFNVPLDFALTNWMMAPVNSVDQFRRDMVSVDWVGVYVARRGDITAQNYAIDDFRIQGVTIPTSVSISGAVSYDGEQESGAIKVYAASTEGTVMTVMANPGNYQIGGLKVATDYTMSAYRDSNGNNMQEFWEPSGTWTGNPAKVYVSDLKDINITMTEPFSADGLPYWWLNKYFGISGPGGQGGGGPSLADVDSDGDGRRNYAEYWAGTDPTNFLSQFYVEIAWAKKAGGVEGVVIRWDSINKRTYAVWRSENLMRGFTRIDFGIAGTPPFNEYDDTTATNRLSSYYYKVQVE